MPERFNFEEAPSEEQTLETQFEHPERVELSGGTIEIVDVKPGQQKTEVPTVMAPGWAATPEVLRDNILTLAEKGRRVISVNAPHGIDAEARQEKDENEHIADAELRKVAALMSALEEKDIEKVDAVAHSEAGIYVTLAATLYPEKFRNIVLVDPAGMIGDDTMKRLSVELSRDILTQVVRGIKDRTRLKPIFRAFREGGKIMAKHPLRAFREALAISNADIHAMLEGLREQGIGISIIHAVDDKAFPMERVQEVVDTKQVDGFYSVKGTHNEFYLKPKQYTALADEALTALERKYKKTEGV